MGYLPTKTRGMLLI